MFVDALLETEFLSRIPPPHRERLTQLAKLKEVSAGTVLFQEQQPHPDLYVIESGHVRIEMFVPGRGRRPVLSLGPGDVLAWSPLLGEGPMTATGVAQDDCRLWSFSGAELRLLCETDHEVGYHVMRQFAGALSKRLVATRLQLLDLFADQQPQG